MAEAEVQDQAAPEQASGGLMKKIMLAGSAVAILGVGIFAGPAVTNLISGSPEEQQDEDAEGESASAAGPAIYNSMHPPIVVNFKDSSGDQHFMQITMEVMSRDQNVINAVREHTPVIRNNLILLYGNSVYEEIVTREGKEKMLADALLEINAVLEQETGEGGVEAAYFTSLVVQ